jgi:DNA processing protein
MGGENGAQALALRGLEGVGDRTFRLLVDRFGSAGRALAAARGDVTDLARDDGKLYEKLRTADLDAARAEAERVEKAGFWVLAYGDPDYPRQLAAIYDPPAVLFGAGKLQGEDRGSVAVVGSRRATPHGVRLAEKLGSGLAAEGLCVVSGLADGIDSAAHRGALEGGGRTVAVFGAGPDVIYPAKNEGLARAVVESGGALVSEHPPGTRPDARFFPRRNRIISGLSLGVVVVEAAEKSGSLITASLALEQGREVFAVPGLAGSHVSRGAHNLLRHGARLTESAADVIEELGLPSLREAPARGGGPDRKGAPEGPAGAVYAAMGDAPEEIDFLAARCGLSAADASAALMELVLSGHVTEWPGKRFSRTIQ